MRFALVCGAIILLLMGAHWAQRAWHGARLVEIDRLPAKAYELKLDINSATWVEWMQLEGIGETLARRIVTNRQESGPFAGVDDLRRVPGIGAKTLDEIRPHLICTDCSPPGDPQ
jgi:competence protein ComEA